MFAVFNFSDKEAIIAPELKGTVTMVLNTDWESFGGKTAASNRQSFPKRISAFSGILYSYHPSNDTN